MSRLRLTKVVCDVCRNSDVFEMQSEFDYSGWKCEWGKDYCPDCVKNDMITKRFDGKNISQQDEVG